MSRNILTTKKLPNEEYLDFTDTSQGKLLFTTYKERPCALLLKEERLLAASFFSKEPSILEGIYIGRVKDVVKSIDAYFVEIAKDMISFLPGKEAKNPILMNREYDGRLCQGDEILVRVIKDAQKTKQPMVSAKNINLQISEQLIEQAKHRTCFTCIKQPVVSWQLALRGLALPEEYSQIITDDPKLYEELVTYQKEKELKKTIRYYEDQQFSLSKLYSLNSKMEDALERRVWMKSGAYLIIEPTEAMTVIDVNSGKYKAKKTKEEYYYEINTQAAQEIARQLRLRNLSGVIVVDFINMKSKEQQDSLLAYMQMLVKDSLVQTMVVDMTALGLMEITRQKRNKPLYEQFRENI